MIRLTRRRVLAALAAAPAAALLGAGAVGARWWDRPAGAGRQALSDDEHAFVDALAEAWFPPGGEPALSGRDARLGDFFDDMLGAMHPDARAELKLLLQALDDLPLATRGQSYRALPLDARIDLLQRWSTSRVWPLRSAVHGVLALIGGGYLTHPDVAPTLQPWFQCPHGR